MAADNEIAIEIVPLRPLSDRLAVNSPVVLKSQTYLFGQETWTAYGETGKLGRIDAEDAKRISFRIASQGAPRAWISEIAPKLIVGVAFEKSSAQPQPQPQPRAKGSVAPRQFRLGCPVILAVALICIAVVAFGKLGGIQSTDNSGTSTISTSNGDEQSPPENDAQQSSGSDASIAPAAAPEALPADLAAFNKANAFAISVYANAPNDLQKSVIRKQRDEMVQAAVLGGAFSQWPGTLQTLGTDGDGDAYIVVKPDGCVCTLETTNNSFSDALASANGQATLIKLGTPLFNKLKNMQEGAHVVVSGRFFNETSLTEAGSVNDPAWLTSFSDVTAAQ